MIENSVPKVADLFRALILGKATGNQHVCPLGRFRRADPSARLVDQQTGAFSVRPFEVEWVEEGIPSSGAQPVTGNLVDVQAEIHVRVGYVLGSDIELVQREMYEDARLIRRVLEEPGNYDQAVTGLMTVERVNSKTSFDTGTGDRRALLEMTFRVECREDQPVAAA